jgi:hypothetical protein
MAAILAVAGVVVEFKAADGELLRIADGVVGIVDAGVQLDGVAVLRICVCSSFARSR